MLAPDKWRSDGKDEARGSTWDAYGNKQFKCRRETNYRYIISSENGNKIAGKCLWSYYEIVEEPGN